jgi:hypothetical protein
MEALNFTCDIEVLRFAESQTINITVVDSAKIGESGKGTTDNGAEQATDLQDGKNHAHLPPALTNLKEANIQQDKREAAGG